MAKIECPSCQFPNEAGARFCTRCGASTEPRVRCPACSHLQAVGNHYCMSCGSEMEGATWQSQPSIGAVIDGVWERDLEEFIRRVDPEDMRTVLGSRVLRVPPGTAGIVLVDGVVERVLPPGQQTTVSLFERIANFFTRKDLRTAFYLVDVRPIPVPFTVHTRPTASGRSVQTQVLVSFGLERGDKRAMAVFIAQVLGDRPAYGARDLFQLLRPEVTRLAGLTLERLAEKGAFRYADAEAEIRRDLSETLSPRYGLAVEVSVAPLTTTASLSFHLGTGQAPTVRACTECAREIPASMRFCDHCGARQPTQLSPDRRCAKCDSSVPVENRFCDSCGEAYTAPPAMATPLFTADGEQVEVDVVVRVQGQHQDFSPDSIAPALVGGVAAYLRDVSLANAGSRAAFAAMVEAVRADVSTHLQSYGLALVELAVVDIRSKKGQWLLSARADMERARSEMLLGREWLAQRADEVDLAELTFAQILRQKQVESAARLRTLSLDMSVAQRERTLHADDAFARDREHVSDRARRQDMETERANLDVADAERDAARSIEVADAARAVENSARAHERQRERQDMDHQMANERTVHAHDAALTRESMTLDSERARQAADDAAYAARSRQNVAFDEHKRDSALSQAIADRDQQRQLDKLRAMAEIDKDMAAQEHAHAKEMRESLRGLSETEMIAAQAAELSKSADGGTAWAQAVSGQAEAQAADERAQQAARHAGEVKELMQTQASQMQDMMKDQLDRMQSLTERVMDSATQGARDAANAQVYERSMDAMSRVAASRAAPAPVAVAPTAVATSAPASAPGTSADVAPDASAGTQPCTSCFASLRAGARFCGSCGTEQ